MKRVLVAGATGYLGRFVTREFKSRGYWVRALHGADLAKVCVDAVDSRQKEIPVGGPETFIHREIAELDFSVAGRNPKITTILAWPVNLAVKAIHPFNEHIYSLSAFFTSAMQMDFATPETGNHTLSNYYKGVLPDLLQYKSDENAVK